MKYTNIELQILDCRKNWMVGNLAMWITNNVVQVLSYSWIF